MDYRYESDESSKELHMSRKAFIIRHGQLDFLPKGSVMSHYEYCKTLGISKEEFNQIIRGYFMKGNLVFYKDNFVYDEDLIQEALKYIPAISQIIGENTFNIYFGHIPQENFRLDLFYGVYKDGQVHKNNPLIDQG